MPAPADATPKQFKAMKELFEAIEINVKEFMIPAGENKVAAIKLVRALTGLGLKEAKEAVEGEQWFEGDVDAVRKRYEHAQEVSRASGYTHHLPFDVIRFR